MPFTVVKFKTISLNIYIETNRYSTNIFNSLSTHIVSTYTYYSTNNSIIFTIKSILFMLDES